jgi:hypothetical protein
MVQVVKPEVGEGELGLASVQRIPAELPAAGSEDTALLELSETFS